MIPRIFLFALLGISTSFVDCARSSHSDITNMVLVGEENKDGNEGKNPRISIFFDTNNNNENDHSLFGHQQL